LLRGRLPLTDVFLRKLDSIYMLDEDDRKAVNRLPLLVADIRADQDVVREGDRPTRSCFLIGGIACWSKTTGSGKRQILSFQIPGDLPDMQSIHLSMLDSTLTTLSPCRIAFVQHEPLRDICERRPNVASAFWRMTLIDAAIFRLTNSYSCELPITQAELADATGLSTVHVNRTLQNLRRQKLIRWKDTKLEVLDWQVLRKPAISKLRICT
jgi:CRP-like cAMP-binding protein